MIKRIALTMFLAFPASSSALDGTDRREIADYVNQANNTLPRRIDSTSVMTSTFFQDDTWYMNVTVTLKGRVIDTAWEKLIRDFHNRNYCKPPRFGLDQGLTIVTQYFNENGTFLLAAKTKDTSCDS